MASLKPVVKTLGGKLSEVKNIIEAAQTRLNAAAASGSSTERLGYKCDLAVSYGEPCHATLVDMDDTTLVLVFDVVRQLEQEFSVDYSRMEHILMTSHCVDTTSRDHHAKSMVLVNKDDDNDATGDIVFSDNPSADQVKNVFSKMKNAILDPAAVVEMKMNEDMVRDILIIAYNHLRMLKTIAPGAKHDSKPIFDLSVLRFPNKDYECFNLYRLQIFMKKRSGVALLGIDANHAFVVTFESTKVGCDATKMKAELSTEDIAAAKKRALAFYGCHHTST